MKEIQEQELIDLAHSTYSPYMQIDDELEITIKSDDGGNHLEFFVSNREAAKYLREAIPHTFEGKRTIVRYRIESNEGE
tara:strand:- start:232 stop:468 length:237 start_codon:yes stop_codon:yes gene_type:complete